MLFGLFAVASVSVVLKPLSELVLVGEGEEVLGSRVARGLVGESKGDIVLVYNVDGDEIGTELGLSTELESAYLEFVKLCEDSAVRR